MEFYTVVMGKSQGRGTLRNTNLEVNWAPSSLRDMIQDPQWMLKLQSTKPYVRVCVVCVYMHVYSYTHIYIYSYTHTQIHSHYVFPTHTHPR